jgi:hypothetical protein
MNPAALDWILNDDWVLWSDGSELQLSRVVSVYPALELVRVTTPGTGRDISYRHILDIVRAEIVVESG